MSDNIFKTAYDRWTGGIDTSQDPRSAEHRDRAQRYALMRQYYESDHPEPLKVAKSGPNHNVIENWVGSIVDDAISMLVGGGVEFTGKSKAVSRFWQENPVTGFSKDVFLVELAQTGMLDGTFYIRLIKYGENYRPVVVDPSHVDILPEGKGYHLIWQSGKKWHRHRIERHGEEGWITHEEEKGENQKKWTSLEVYPWDHDFAPMRHFKNLPRAVSEYGLPLIKRLSTQNAINSVASSTNKSIYYFGNPIQILKNVDAKSVKTIDIGVGKALVLDNEKSDVSLLELQGDMSASRIVKEDQINNYHMTNGATRNDPETAKSGALSGFALQLLFMKSLATNDLLRMTYGGALKWCNYVAQALGGEAPEEVDNIWADALPSNEKEKSEIFTALEPVIGPYLAALRAGYSEKEANEMAENEMISPLGGGLNDTSG